MLLEYRIQQPSPFCKIIIRFFTPGQNNLISKMYALIKMYNFTNQIMYEAIFWV